MVFHIYICDVYVFFMCFEGYLCVCCVRIIVMFECVAFGVSDVCVM